MDAEEKSNFLASRSRHPASMAARFVENRIAVPGRPFAVYSEQLDSFVTVQEAKEQENIRLVYVAEHIAKQSD